MGAVVNRLDVQPINGEKSLSREQVTKLLLQASLDAVTALNQMRSKAASLDEWTQKIAGCEKFLATYTQYGKECAEVLNERNFRVFITGPGSNQRMVKYVQSPW
jgi:carboxypeptidase C (cathepsin A)